MIMETIDTGDIIFTKQNCDYSISFGQYVTCLKKQIWPDHVLKFDDAYIAIRKNEYEVDVLGDWATFYSGEENSKPGLISYQQFLRSPLYNEVALRKLKIDVESPEFKELYAKRALLIAWELEQEKRLKEEEEDTNLYDVEIEDFENNDVKSKTFLQKYWTANIPQKNKEIDKIVSFLIKEGQIKELAKTNTSRFERY